MIEIRTLGQLSVRSRADGTEIAIPQPKRGALLAYLAAAEPKGFHRRDTLLALLWPEMNAASARHGLSQFLSALRSSLPPGTLVTRGDTEVGLDWDHVWCDVATLRDHLASGRSEEALALYRGPLLSGFFLSGAPEFERWLETERSRVHQQVSDAAWSRAQMESDPVEAARLARRAAAFSELDEGVVCRLLTFLIEVGDRAGALDAYRAFATRLAEEYELEPSAETRALVEAIERGAKPPGRRGAGRAAATAIDAVVESVHGSAAPQRGWLSRSVFGALLVGVIVAIVAGAFTLVRSGNEIPPPVPNSYLVVPFAVSGPDSTHDWLSTAAPAMLAYDLEAWEDVRVVDPRRSAAIAESLGVELGPQLGLRDAVAIARAARAQTLVFGEVIAQAGRLEIAVRQYDARSGDQFDTVQRIDGAAEGDVRPLIDGLAAQILNLRAVADVTPDLSAATTASLGAYRAFLSGLHHLRNWEIGDAASAFHTAIALDSTFGQAYYRLAIANEWMPGRNQFRDKLGDTQETCRLMTLATRHARAAPVRELRHINAYTAYACNPDVALARELYHEILTADSSDAEAWFHLANVEYWDDSLTQNAEGNLMPRGDLNLALRGSLRSVELDPRFHLGYGFAFDLLNILNTRGFASWDVTGDYTTADEPLDQVYFYLAWTDSIEWIPVDPTDWASVIDPFLEDSVARPLQDRALAMAQRWVNAAPELAAPRAVLRDAYIERKAYDIALEHERASFRLGSGTGQVSTPLGETASDTHRGRLAALHLAAGNFDSAATLVEEILDVQRESGRRAPNSAVSVLTALGQPRRALDEVFSRFRPTRWWIPGVGEKAIDFTESVPLLWQIETLTSAGVLDTVVTAALDSLRILWRSSYSREEREIVYWSMLIYVGPALLLLDAPAVRQWFAEAADIDVTSEPRFVRLAQAWRPYRLLIEDSLQASAAALDELADWLTSPAQDFNATRRYVLGTVAQRLGLHEMAVRLFESVEDVVPRRGLWTIDLQWALVTRSYLDRARSYEALGKRRQAVNGYRTFLSAWGNAGPEAQYLADEARRAVDRLRGGSE